MRKANTGRTLGERLKKCPAFQPVSTDTERNKRPAKRRKMLRRLPAGYGSCSPEIRDVGSGNSDHLLSGNYCHF
jgi:hypothetical protein